MIIIKTLEYRFRIFAPNDKWKITADSTIINEQRRYYYKINEPCRTPN